MKKSIFLFFAAILCAMSVSAKTIYLNTGGSSLWNQAGAWFAMYLCNGSEDAKWYQMTAVPNAPDVYQVDVDDALLTVAKNKNVIFARKDPANTNLDWNGVWNQTADLENKLSSNNCYTITGWGSTDGSWSTYTPPTTAPEYYLTGTLAGGWNANDIKMTYDEATETYSHTFTAVAAGELHQFKVTDGTWSNSWGGAAVSPAIEGVTTGSDGNVAFTLSTGGDVTITFKDFKIQLTTTGSFTPVETFDYYVVGSFNGWNTADAAYGMTKDGDVYKKEVTFAAAVQFKVCKGSWEAGAWGANNLGDNKYKELGGTDNLEMKEEKTFTIIFNPAQNLLTFEGLTPEAVVKYDYYLIGTINGWALKDANYGMTDEDADGVYEKEVTLTANNKHELKINNGSWDDNTQIFGFDQLNVAYEGVSRGSGDGDNNVVIELTEDKTITVKFDKNAGKITLDGLTEKVVEYGVTFNVTVPEGTEACYICGAWDWETFKPMTKVDDTHYTLEIAEATKDHGYKYTCGEGWEFVEKDAEGNDLAGDRTWSENDVVAAWAAPAEPVEMASVVLLGVEGDWTDGIEMELNPYDANEYMLLCQSITADEPIKIKAVDTQSNVNWCAKLADTSAGTVEKDADGNDNIVLEEGKYDFYYKVAENEVWIGTCTETEPEYMVVEEEITNFVFDMEAWPMVCMGGPSKGYQIEVFLVLTEDADGTLSYEDCSVSIMGQDVTLIEGTLSNIDPYAPYADAVLRVQMGEEYYELHLAMSAAAPEPIEVVVENATVTLSEYEVSETESAYELIMIANWTYEKDGLTYEVECLLPTFDPTNESGNYAANFYVRGDGDAFGMNEGVLVTVTKDGNNVTLTGNVSALNGNVYNVTISGTLPTETPDYTRTVASGSYGTICLPSGSSKVEGAKFYEVTYKKDGYIYADEVTTLVAGMPYIFQATSTEIKVYYNETTATAGSNNGVYGTFSDITDGDAGTAGNVLEGKYLLVAGPAVQKCGGNCSLKANRAYFVVSEITTNETQPLPGRKRIALGCQEENQATGLDNITENGIVAPAMQGTYDILGRQLSEPAANGFYIINGKKMFVVK